MARRYFDESEDMSEGRPSSTINAMGVKSNEQVPTIELTVQGGVLNRHISAATQAVGTRIKIGGYFEKNLFILVTLCKLAFLYVLQAQCPHRATS